MCVSTVQLIEHGVGSAKVMGLQGTHILINVYLDSPALDESVCVKIMSLCRHYTSCDKLC